MLIYNILTILTLFILILNHFSLFLLRLIIKISNMYELKGKLLIKEDVQQVSGTFKKRDFVIEVENEKDPKWNDFVKFQLTQDNCSKIDACNVGDTINVSFNVRGRKWEKDGKVSYFTNLEGWKIEKETASGKVVDTSMSQEYPPSASEGADDLPF